MSFANNRTRLRVLVLFSAAALIAVCFLLISPIITALWNIELFRAASSGDSNALKTLLDDGADPNLRDYDGEPVIAYAAKAGQAEAVRVLISYGADVDAEFDSDHRNSLGVAAYRGHTDVVKVLIEHGAKPDKGALGRTAATPLMMAASRGYVEIVELLLQAGANINARDEFGKTAKDCALRSIESQDVIELQLQRANAVRARMGGNWPTSEEEVRAALSQVISLLSQAESKQ